MLISLMSWAKFYSGYVIEFPCNHNAIFLTPKGSRIRTCNVSCIWHFVLVTWAIKYSKSIEFPNVLLRSNINTIAMFMHCIPRNKSRNGLSFSKKVCHSELHRRYVKTDLIKWKTAGFFKNWKILETLKILSCLTRRILLHAKANISIPRYLAKSSELFLLFLN